MKSADAKTTETIYSIAARIISRRQDGSFGADQVYYDYACDAETDNLLALAMLPADGRNALRCKARALSVTPFMTNDMIDAPAPGEKELLASIIEDLIRNAALSSQAGG